MKRELSVAPEILGMFWDLRIAAITAEGVDATTPWPEVDVRLGQLEREVAAGTWAVASEDDARIQEWHEAYRRFGTNPRRQRPSVDALTRRLARTGRLPRINPAVDCYNLISVTHTVPVGAYDLSRVTGVITIRHPREGDVFVPLGEPDAEEIPGPREVVYADEARVLTRHWNHRDADHTKVMAGSRSVLFLIETTVASLRGTEVLTAARDLQTLIAPHARETSIDILDAGEGWRDAGHL